jgi:ATP-binding cassette subfamily B multidrug efflux pump
MPAMMFVANLNYVAIAVIGGLRVASGAISLGDVTAFIQYSRQFSQPLTQVASMANLLQSGVASAERVFEVLDAPEQSADASPAVTPEKVLGRVAFEDVSFSYDPAAAHRAPGPGGRAGPDHRHRRAHRCRQDHAGQSPAPLL